MRWLWNSIAWLAGLVRRRVVQPILRIDDTPESIAGGVSLGLIVALTPTMGGQMVITIVLGTFLRWVFGIRWNLLAGSIVCWVTNPLTAIPIYWFNYLVGCVSMGRSPIGYETFRKCFDMELATVARELLYEFVIPLWVGSAIVGIVASVGSYPITVRLIRRGKERWRRFRSLRRRRDTRQIVRAERWGEEGRPERRRAPAGLREWWQDQPLVLASASESRREVLAALGTNYSILSPRTDDVAPSGEPVERQVVERALEKARSIAGSVAGGWIVAGHTLLVHGGDVVDESIFDHDPAKALRRLAGDVHEAVTGLVLLDPRDGRTVEGVARSRVHVRSVDDAAIQEYLASGKGHGTAGGYELAGMNDPIVATVEGDRTTVLGLPRPLLVDLMERMRRMGSVPCEEGHV